jgi:hypothetical protein
VSGGLEVRGARTLRRDLKRAGIAVHDLKQAHAAAAKVVEIAADPRTPRRSGELADTLRSSGTARAAIVRAGNARHPYAGPVHWGWPSRNIHAQPWIAETAEDTQPATTQLYLNAVQTIIDAIEGAPGP